MCVYVIYNVLSGVYIEYRRLYLALDLKIDSEVKSVTKYGSEKLFCLNIREYYLYF